MSIETTYRGYQIHPTADNTFIAVIDDQVCERKTLQGVMDVIDFSFDKSNRPEKPLITSMHQGVMNGKPGVHVDFKAAEPDKTRFLDVEINGIRHSRFGPHIQGAFFAVSPQAETAEVTVTAIARNGLSASNHAKILLCQPPAQSVHAWARAMEDRKPARNKTKFVKTLKISREPVEIHMFNCHSTGLFGIVKTELVSERHTLLTDFDQMSDTDNNFVTI